jgi:hypothetical protein
LISQYKKEVFLTCFEDWINEVVAVKADGHNEAIPGMINEGFQHSMLANSDFHKAMADALGETGNTSLASYHVIMSKVYRSFLAA